MAADAFGGRACAPEPRNRLRAMASKSVIVKVRWLASSLLSRRLHGRSQYSCRLGRIVAIECGDVREAFVKRNPCNFAVRCSKVVALCWADTSEDICKSFKDFRQAIVAKAGKYSVLRGVAGG